MKVLFVYSIDDAQSVSKPLRDWSYIQFGISYISSALKFRGRDTSLVVLGSNNEWRDNAELLGSSIEQYSPDIIAFTSVVSQYPFIREVAAFVKGRWPGKLLVIGGVHASLNPEEVITGPFDALCVGEGEFPMAELCDQMENGSLPHGIANLWIKSPGGAVEKNAARPFLQDLDALPLPDRAMWEPWLKAQPGSEIAVSLGRGCPYDCTYCCNHSIKKIASGKYVRMRSPERIVSEISSLHRKYPDEHRFYFEVESIALNKKWLFELCDRLEAFNATIDNSIGYGCNFRVTAQSVDEKVFAALKRANVQRINIGLESGSERVRREVLKRDYSNEEFLKAVRLARDHGFKFRLFNMIGLPGETYAEHLETVAMNRRCQPDVHYTGIFFPYVGTELYRVCVSKGLIQEQPQTDRERKHATMSLPGFTQSQIQNAYTWFNYRVYRGYRPLWWILATTARVKIGSSPRMNKAFRRLVQLPFVKNMRAKLVRR